MTEIRTRRGLAHLLALVGLLSLSVWWVAWVTSESILNEARSGDIGTALVEHCRRRDHAPAGRTRSS